MDCHDPSAKKGAANGTLRGRDGRRAEADSEIGWRGIALMLPKEIRLAKNRASLEIEWDDGAMQRLRAPILRANCRSSSAIRQSLAGRAAAEPSDLRITRIEPVGSYAVNLAFSDGEERGIYPWSLLRSLGE
jgi:DUF971 family protein